MDFRIVRCELPSMPGTRCSETLPFPLQVLCLRYEPDKDAAYMYYLSEPSHVGFARLYSLVGFATDAYDVPPTARYLGTVGFPIKRFHGFSVIHYFAIPA